MPSRQSPISRPVVSRSASSRWAVVLPGRQPQLEQGIVLARLDLGGQHPGCGLPSLAALALGIEHQNAAPAERQLPGARGPDRPTTHHDNIVGSSHLSFL